MKTFIYRLVATLAVAAALSGCATAPQESAMEWLQRQPAYIDP